MLILTREDLKGDNYGGCNRRYRDSVKVFSTGKLDPLRTVININEAKNEDIMSMPGYIEDMGRQ